ncbi:hypothetical protein ACFW5D_37215 [Streptomyces sp. NPDC058770]|uniref:hypothetical protein n=1 Tax=Streptomyces sp. NPDC058770 TaxID=3346631 RepID=UPI003687E329
MSTALWRPRYWLTAKPFPLDRFVAAICANTTRPHRLRAKGRRDDGKWRWVTRPYFDLEEEQVQATARREQVMDRLVAVHRRQREAREAAEQEHLAAIEALLQRQKALVKPVVKFVYHEAGAYPGVAGDGLPEFAMGVPVYLRRKPYAVICPVASRVPALRKNLAPLIHFAASERERNRIAAQTVPGQRVEVLAVEVPPAPASVVPPRREQSGLTIKQAVNKMFGLRCWTSLSDLAAPVRDDGPDAGRESRAVTRARPGLALHVLACPTCRAPRGHAAAAELLRPGKWRFGRSAPGCGERPGSTPRGARPSIRGFASEVSASGSRPRHSYPL